MDAAFEVPGSPERLALYAADGAEVTPRHWVVTLTGMGRTVPLGDLSEGGAQSPGVYMPRILGAITDGTGRGQAIIRVTHGASTEFLAFYGIRAGKLVEAGIGGRPRSLPDNGSVGHLDGVQCVDTGIVTRGVGSSDGFKTFAWTRDEYSWRGADLRLDHHYGGTLNGSPGGADPHGSFAAIDCQSMRAAVY